MFILKIIDHQKKIIHNSKKYVKRFQNKKVVVDWLIAKSNSKKIREKKLNYQGYIVNTDILRHIWLGREISSKKSTFL